MCEIFRVAIFTLILQGVTVLAGDPEPGTVMWAYDLGNWIVSAPALGTNGNIYVGTDTGLYAITNSSTIASNKWVFSSGVAGVPLIAADGTIYFGSADLNFYALNPDGSLKWSLPFRQIPPTSAAIGNDGTLYVQADGILYGLFPTGAQKWAHTNYSDTRFGTTGTGSPIVAPDGTIYVCTGGANSLSAYAPDGTLRWSYTPGNGAFTGDSAAIAADGTIYFSAPFLIKLTQTGTNIPIARTNVPTSSPIVGLDGTIYVSAEGHKLCAVTPGGQVLWKKFGDNQNFNPPVAPVIDAAGTIFYCSSNSVFALNPQGQILWTVYGGTSLPGVYLATTSPLIGPDGTIYAALGSKLYAIHNTNKLSDSPWPMCRQNPRHTGKSEKPSLQQPKKRADANFEFQLHAQIDQPQTVQTSTDLVSWTALTNVLVTNVPMDVVDLSASNFTSRFYRTVSP